MSNRQETWGQAAIAVCGWWSDVSNLGRQLTSELCISSRCLFHPPVVESMSLRYQHWRLDTKIRGFRTSTKWMQTELSQVKPPGC